MKRIWIIPVNDGEAVASRDYLRRAGEVVATSGQPWGASWARLEPEVVETITKFKDEHPDGIVYGFELAGPNSFGAVDIDHHFYAGDDRRNLLCSLEQVAAIIGTPLNRYEQFVAENDKNYIPGMQRLGAELGMTAPEIAGMVEVVRAADRCSQGVTPDDEALAVGDVADAVFTNGPFVRRVTLEYSTPSTTAQADLLFGKAVESLYKGPKWIYFGPRHLMLAGLNLPEQHWSGGAPESGYFGIIAPGPESQAKILEIFNSQD